MSCSTACLRTFEILALVWTVSSAATITPPQSISQNLASIFNVSNLSIPNHILNDTDPRFSLRGTYGHENLNIIACLMNAVNGLADFAHQPYQKRVSGLRLNPLPQYPNIEILIGPVRPASDVEIRTAIFGLYYTVFNMIQTTTFLNAEFDLRWDGIAVARIIIDPKPGSSTTVGGSANPTQDITAQAPSPSNDTVTPQNATLASPNTGLVPSFAYFPQGSRLTYQEVFVTVMATLKNVAQFPETDVVEPFRSGAEGFDARMQFLQEETPRTQPPFYIYSYVIDTVRKIPAYMVENKRFAELAIVVEYDEEDIGRAVLEKGSPGFDGAGGGGGGGGGGANVSSA